MANQPGNQIGDGIVHTLAERMERAEEVLADELENGSEKLVGRMADIAESASIDLKNLPQQPVTELLPSQQHQVLAVTEPTHHAVEPARDHDVTLQQSQANDAKTMGAANIQANPSAYQQEAEKYLIANNFTNLQNLHGHLTEFFNRNGLNSDAIHQNMLKQTADISNKQVAENLNALGVRVTEMRVIEPIVDLGRSA
jgi:hypothetical protein